MMAFLRLLAAILLLYSTNTCCHALSLVNKPRGSAVKPFEKQKVAVLGGGGYLASNIFGFLQRCSSLYGSGIGGVRCIGATAYSAECLNRVLSKNFILGFAGEEMIRLTDMTSVESIKQRLEGHSAVVMGNEYYLEQRPVTANTYETTPNDKTMEFFLDLPRRGADDLEFVSDDYQTLLLENTLQACRDCESVQHLIVVESPNTTPTSAVTCAKLLDESKLNFTYLKINGELHNFKDYTFEKGIQGILSLESFTFAPDYTQQQDYKAGSWINDLGCNDSNGVVFREDVAALAVQCLQSLDGNTSRCIVVSSIGTLENYEKFSGRRDKEWCVHSEVLAEKLQVVQ